MPWCQKCETEHREGSETCPACEDQLSGSPATVTPSAEDLLASSGAGCLAWILAGIVSPAFLALIPGGLVGTAECLAVVFSGLIGFLMGALSARPASARHKFIAWGAAAVPAIGLVALTTGTHSTDGVPANLLVLASAGTVFPAVVGPLSTIAGEHYAGSRRIGTLLTWALALAATMAVFAVGLSVTSRLP